MGGSISFVVGEVEVVPLLDAVGVLGELAELYPDVSADEWNPYRDLYPELFAGASWRIRCTCYLIRSEGTTVLVDTGVGPPGLWGWEAEREGLLPAAFHAADVGRGDIDIVFLTHLHIDHLGWNTDAHGVTFFPRARYLVHRDALAFARTRPELPHIRRCVEPLADQFEQLAGEFKIAPGVAAFPAPGRYPGHMGVRIDSNGEQAVLLADVALHPALLDRPDWGYVSDLNPEVTIATRKRLIEELVDSDALVACGHYPDGGIGRIVRRNEMVVWETE
ncbi:MAG: MBL fold metallo-hydrolase [Actinobacteria bacterium]|nr:MBL fold metallo-hydrolase [Actinomycetota bacterium]